VAKNTAVWKSLVNQEMIDSAELSDSEIAQLIQDLDDAVVQVCEEYGVR
jgi:collagenase-like PrtC family protease